MPSPLGHAIAGLTVHVATAHDEDELLDLRRIGVVTLASLAPDVDFLFKLFDGRNHHQQETHSIGFALLAALAAALAFRVVRLPSPLRSGIAVGLGWLSHVLLDYLNNDTHPPIGLLALWPFDDGYYKFPWPIFLDVGRSPTWATVRNNLLAAAWETLVLLPVLWLAWRLRGRRLRG